MLPTVDLVEYAYGCYLPGAVRQHPDVQKAVSLSVLISCLMNDLFSYEKEVLRYGSRFNLLAVMMNANDLTFDEAVDCAVRKLNNLMDAFPATTPDLEGADLKLYYQALRDIVNGAWFFQISTNRYRSRSSPFPELRLK
mmetsp:Transcript_28513/g.46044  ORF Transcript_28513/g.46044 Transcript_28513/m.46044 type:complete len:139 (+) Transcript_28513:316-732(+)